MNYLRKLVFWTQVNMTQFQIVEHFQRHFPQGGGRGTSKFFQVPGHLCKVVTPSPLMSHLGKQQQSRKDASTLLS